MALCGFFQTHTLFVSTGKEGFFCTIERRNNNEQTNFGYKRYTITVSMVHT